VSRREPFGEAEAEGELLVVSRRPHRHGDRLAVDADLERFLDCDGVAFGHGVGKTDDVDVRGRVGRSLAHRG
jgi:hypothetical protein